MWTPEGAEIISGREALAAKLVGIAGTARNQMALVSQRLDRALYARAELIDAMTRFILRHERCRLRALIVDVRAASADGNIFLEWARRLPSRVELRQLPPELAGQHRYERLIADREQVLQRDHADLLESAYLASAPRVAVDLVKDFDALWEQSQASAELRALHGL